MHAALVSVHAAAAVTSLLAAVVVLLPRGLPRRAARTAAVVLVAATAVMALALAAAVASGWRDQPTVAHVVFVGLGVLAAVAAGQAARAARAVQRRTPAEASRLYDAGGFVLITQVTGFAAIAVLDVLPTAGVVITAVLTVLVARLAVGHLRAAAQRRAAAGAGPAAVAPAE
ncbi:hypothetical protein FHN55_14885 [Streptomyces sp. NP160]|uniref:hypothetical protein n=1 Tax=Streptomyces sp. NP160 TaxID=2586637 RepID=UPI00111B5AA7|nr:hypothetical protein [Streptomyces sp. NP160]TNM64111.1 hypothetical protein FHN55_14885 [Streptomyces sp. NP160]